jgi:hypothetical protein
MPPVPQQCAPHDAAAARRVKTRRCFRTIARGAAVASALVLGACTTLRSYPQQLPGWHSPHYHILFGRLSLSHHRRSWVLEYDVPTSTDPYGGRVALTPATALRGYTVGQLVQVNGRILHRPNKLGTGTLYGVTKVRLWHPKASW